MKNWLPNPRVYSNYLIPYNMQFTVLGSNSSGNCYLLHNDLEALIIEAGINFNQVKQALNFDISKVKGCLVTHEHLDHSGFMLNIASAGIPIYSSLFTFQSSKTQHHNYNPVSHRVKFDVGRFSVMPLRVEHDASEPFCYVISHPEIGTMLFMTDTFTSRYRFDNTSFNHVVIEANYSHEIVNKNIAAGASLSLRNRILFSHMEFATTISLLRSYVSKTTQNVVLIHLSDSNSNAFLFKEKAQSVCKPPTKVSIASPGLTLPFNITPF